MFMEKLTYVKVTMPYSLSSVNEVKHSINRVEELVKRVQ